MTLLRLSIVLAAIGFVLCIWLLAQVTWYTFVAFMVVAQPLLLTALLIFLVVAVRDLRRRDLS